MSATLQSPRTTVKRLAKRGLYDAETVHAILDEALICHVGFLANANAGAEPQPVVIPTIHWRVGETLYFHGSAASRMLRSMRDDGFDACATVTLLDGLVMARSAFHHSMNYRSVVVMGKARLVEGEEKVSALASLVEHVCRGRSADVREPNDAELRQTLVLAMPIDEASAKIRTGPPLDDEEDYTLGTWAGVIPLKLVAQPPVADPLLTPGIEPPAYALDYRR
jgi:nitroimidazol reductase NimA-like FMN-containing flavoprotein (pyridoxamine 5'-phosphate oxidase superfamily)